MPKFQEFVDIVESFGKLAGAANEISTLIDAIRGADGIESILNTIDADLRAGFQAVVAALQEQTLISQWQTAQDALSYAYQVTYDLSQTLHSAELVDGTVLVRTPQGRRISLVDWCDGAAAPLQTLSGLLAATPVNGGQTQSVYGIFTYTYGPGTSVLDLWEQIWEAANGRPASPLLAFLQNKLLFDAVLMLERQVFNLVSSIYYSHDALLALYLKSNPANSNGYISVKFLVDSNFGDGASTMAWYMFDAKLDAVRTKGEQNGTPDPLLAVPRSAVTNQNYPGPDSCTGFDLDWYSFVNAPTTIADAGVANGFFAALQFQPVSMQNNNNYPGWEVCTFFLQGTPVEIGPDLVCTPKPAIPSLDSQNYPGNAFSYINNNIPMAYLTAATTGTGYGNATYVPPAVSTNPNIVKVVTGYQCVALDGGNRLAIALQFGDLDVTDPKNPTVTISDSTFHSPTWATPCYYQLQDYVDCRPTGQYSLNSTPGQLPKLDPNGMITNVTLTKLANRVGLNVQMAPTIYKADFMQPSKLPAIGGLPHAQATESGPRPVAALASSAV